MTPLDMADESFPCGWHNSGALDASDQMYLIHHGLNFNISTFGFEIFIGDTCADD